MDKDIELLNKYKELIEKDYKNEIINKMKNDVKGKLKDMSKEELEHFCNNLYVLCILKVNNINEQEIINQLMCRNNIFVYEMEKENKMFYNYYFDIELDYYTKIKNKYLKIIKEMIELK